MRKSLLFLTFFFTIISIEAQISVSSRHVGPPGKISQEQFEKFKNSTTIFVLSNIVDKETYVKILNDSWDVTPFKVVKREDFDVSEYLSGNFSFVVLEGYHTLIFKQTYSVDYIYIYLHFFMYDLEKLKKGLDKIKPNKKNTEDKIKDLFSECKIDFARVDLFPKDEFTHLVLDKENKTVDIMDAVYNDSVFYNYSSGFLKNGFQKVNNQIKEEKIYWMYGDGYLEELKNLTTDTLYIPTYHKVLFNPFTIEDKEDSDKIEEVLSSYDYNYKFIDNDKLDEKILSGEEFYYLKYIRVNSQKFVSIINGKTGEVVYRNYYAGTAFSYNLKSKNIKQLNGLIRKAAKKS